MRTANREEASRPRGHSQGRLLTLVGVELGIVVHLITRTIPSGRHGLGHLLLLHGFVGDDDRLDVVLREFLRVAVVVQNTEVGAIIGLDYPGILLSVELF